MTTRNVHAENSVRIYTNRADGKDRFIRVGATDADGFDTAEPIICDTHELVVWIAKVLDLANAPWTFGASPNAYLLPSRDRSGRPVRNAYTIAGVSLAGPDGEVLMENASITVQAVIARAVGDMATVGDLEVPTTERNLVRSGSLFSIRETAQALARAEPAVAVAAAPAIAVEESDLPF